MRRLAAKEEERSKKRRSDGSRSSKKKDDSLNLFERAKKYFKEVRSELKKVNWPSREELMTYTVVVFGMTTVLTMIVFGMDWAFNKLVISLLDVMTS
jgi:preprotein translocase subunit SecE